jgi:hypothetical protein
MWLAGTRAPTLCDRDRGRIVASETFPNSIRISATSPVRQAQKAPSPNSILHQSETKEKMRNYCRADTNGSNDNDDDSGNGLQASNPRGRGKSRRPPSHALG